MAVGSYSVFPSCLMIFYGKYSHFCNYYLLKFYLQLTMLTFNLMLLAIITDDDGNVDVVIIMPASQK